MLGPLNSPVNENRSFWIIYEVASSIKVKDSLVYILEVAVQLLSHVRFFATPWTVAHQALLSIGFPKQEYWSGLPFPPPGNPPDPGIKPALPASPVLAGGFLTTEPRGKPQGSPISQVLTGYISSFKHVFFPLRLEMKRLLLRLEFSLTEMS